MGEIKSTLDLVMERTRNLTLSDEEKQAHKQMEIASRIKGLLQKMLDGMLTEYQFETDYVRLKKEADLPDDRLLVDEILTRLDPDQDPQPLLALLEACCRLDPAPFRTTINDYREAYKRAAQKSSARLIEDLAQKHCISGSAVLANLEADGQWRRAAQDMRRQFEESLNQARVRLINR